MTKKEIADRKLYLDTLKTQLSLDDNQSVMTEMSMRAKQVEAILKALTSANINRDNIPGIDMYLNLEKNLVIKSYLKDLFFWDSIKLKSNGTDQILIAKGNYGHFAKLEGLDPRSDETYNLFSLEFSKVLDCINASLSYYQVENIDIIKDFDKPISKLWIKFLPSDEYLEYLDSIKFISHNRFLKKKR